MSNDDVKKVMLEHSQAKVSLYGKYLSIYLNILRRVSSVNKIFIFDLLCGEGIYEDGGKGSPFIALNAIKNHYDQNNETCPVIDIWFNDNGLSGIDKDIYKVDRVERLCQDVFIPPGVSLNFFREDFQKIYLKGLHQIPGRNISRDIKGLFFIDPYGYKDIKPQHLKTILANGNTEIILFLPISQMYRFAAKSIQATFPGGDPLREFLAEIFQLPVPSFSSAHDFIDQLKNGLRNYLLPERIFVDTFTLERDQQNIYCLFFFTSHIKGLRTMLEAKWDMDTSQGRGFTLEKTLPLFSGVKGSDYPQELEQYITHHQHRTNQDLYVFGLSKGYLPKHTKEVLAQWKKERPNFEVIALDKDPRPIRGFYIDEKPDRVIGVKLR